MNKFSLNSFVGNVYTRGLIARQLQNKTFSQFTIFEGTYGTGKSSAAKIASMQLTCESPIGEDPCCVCPTCKMNMKAFRTTGESSSVKIVNLGKFTDKTEVNELIKNVFDLRTGDKPIVYVFEEVHVLKNLKGAQTAFLAEIDKMPKNVYVIMCTTRGYDVIPELANRAMRFKFNRLSSTESRELIDDLTDGQLSVPLKNLLVRYSRGIPRSIENGVEFITKNAVSEEEYREYVQDVSEESLCTLFMTMRGNDMNSFIDACKGLVDSREVRSIYVALKELLVNTLFSRNGVDGMFSAYTISCMNEIFDDKNLNKCLALVDSYTETLSETDLLFLFYRMRLAVQERTVKSVFAESTAKASEKHESLKMANATEPVMQPVSVLQPINLHKVNSFEG